jgi:hypothetical protein
MHSPSNLRLVEQILWLAVGVVLVGQGIRWSAQRNSVKNRKLSNATIFGLRTVLISSGLFLIVISALLAFGLMKR